MMKRLNFYLIIQFLGVITNSTDSFSSPFFSTKTINCKTQIAIRNRGGTTNSNANESRKASTELNMSIPRRKDLNHKDGQKSESTPRTTFKKIQNPLLQRGSNYGLSNNSTIPQPHEVAQTLNIKPTKEATKQEWQRAWKAMKFILPFLHIFDRCKPVDSSLNLACMWWKALSGNDKSSPVYDNGLSYDILPSFFRLLAHPRLCGFYPRLHHANVELRTAFLDNAIEQIVSDVNENNNSIVQNGNKVSQRTKKIRLICFGAGYDLRSIKLLERGLVDEAFEFDLPQVVESKKKLIGSKRLLRRRPWLKKEKIQNLKLIPSDLNNIDQLREQLRGVLMIDENEDDEYHTIFVFEGVMIYLNEGIPSSLLKVTSTVLKEIMINKKTTHQSVSSGSLCFADRLENIPGGDYKLGNEELHRNGWKLRQWCPKPGLARHMGSAILA